jgi:hypothetical protein
LRSGRAVSRALIDAIRADKLSARAAPAGVTAPTTGAASAEAGEKTGRFQLANGNATPWGALARARGSLPPALLNHCHFPHSHRVFTRRVSRGARSFSLFPIKGPFSEETTAARTFTDRESAGLGLASRC